MHYKVLKQLPYLMSQNNAQDRPMPTSCGIEKKRKKFIKVSLKVYATFYIEIKRTSNDAIPIPMPPTILACLKTNSFIFS